MFMYTKLNKEIWDDLVSDFKTFIIYKYNDLDKVIFIKPMFID